MAHESCATDCCFGRVDAKGLAPCLPQLASMKRDLHKVRFRQSAHARLAGSTR